MTRNLRRTKSTEADTFLIFASGEAGGLNGKEETMKDQITIGEKLFDKVPSPMVS